MPIPTLLFDASTTKVAVSIIRLLPVILVPVIVPKTAFAAVWVKLPVDAPVKLPVPTVNTSALSSHPINILSELPLSRISPASLEGVPLVPVPNSISKSSIVVLVAELVTVEPFTIRLPVTVTFPAAVIWPPSAIVIASSASVYSIRVV